jgi:hypothetical protein
MPLKEKTSIMKRFLLLLIGSLLFNTFAFAQLGERIQRGRATQEMTGEGLRASHFNIPLDSTVKVTNTENQEEIDVIITGRIPASSSRIIDLSLEAYNALRLTNNTIVMITYSPPLTIRSNTEPHGGHPGGGDAVAGFSGGEDANGGQLGSEDAVAGFSGGGDASGGQPGGEDAVAGFSGGEDASGGQLGSEDAVAGLAGSEMSRLNTALPIFHLLVLDRENSVPDAGLEDTDSLSMLYYFKHERSRYLVALYVSHNNGMVFPQLPDNSFIIVNMTTARRNTIIEYVNSAEFRRFVSDEWIINNILRAIRNYR